MWATRDVARHGLEVCWHDQAVDATSSRVSRCCQRGQLGQQDELYSEPFGR